MKKKILMLVNHDVTIYNFRLELVEELLKNNYEVHLSSPAGTHTGELIGLGVHFHEIEINRHSVNPAGELSILREYRRLCKSIKPDAILSYTLKPNIYGALAGKKYNVPVIANITGIGMALGTDKIKRDVAGIIYRFVFRDIYRVFMQNRRDLKLFQKKRIAAGKLKLLPGSGVNLKRFIPLEYPPEDKPLVFVVIGRIMKIKGVDEYFEAARIIKSEYPDITFRMTGFFDGDYEEKVHKLQSEGIISYTEQQEDMVSVYREANAVIHTSHLEGMSNVLLEAAASARPVIAAAIPGCREIFDEGKTGFGFTRGSVDELVKAVQKFILLPYEDKKRMGEAGRKKVELEFDRDIVVSAYMDELEKLMHKQ